MTPARRRLLMGAALLVILGAALAAYFGAGSYFSIDTRAKEGRKAAKGPPSVPVTVATVLKETVPVQLAAIGNVEAYSTVALKARVDGQIVEVNFKEGAPVKKGEVLFRIDPRPYDAALRQAQANALRDAAARDQARSQERRYQELVEKNFVSKEAYAQIRTNAETAAAVAKASEAALEQARLNLEYCTIRSPLEGFVGKVLLQAGNLVKANDVNPLVVINQVRPIYVNFAVPEQSLPEVRKRMADAPLEVEVLPADPKQSHPKGRLIFVDNAVDPSTGTIRLRAQFTNEDAALWPGQFVNVSVRLYDEADALIIPSTAVQSGPEGPYVYVVSEEMTAELRRISPETMASAVATPLEKQFSTIPGIDEMSSVSSQGTTRITLQFALDRDIDAAAQDVNSAIAATARQLPASMPAPPSFRKVNPADFPVYFLALSSDTLPISTVNEYAETFLAQRISTISGVAQVQVFGQQKYAVRVQVDPNALAARGVGINEVEQAVAQANVNLPTGTLYGKDRMFAVQATGQLNDAAAFRPVIVTYRNGSPVRLQELGRVVDSVQNDKVAAWYKDKRGIVLAIYRQPGTNTIQVVDEIKKLTPTFRAEVPPAIAIEVLYDRSQSIRASVGDVKFTLFLDLALVVLVIFLFLRNIPATVIPSIALPMSIIGTFAVMYLFNYSLDNISLMALTLCVGFVVDDAIVMLENVTRHIEAGKSPLQATLEGSREIVFTIISMTLSLAAVFIPVLFMGGILGRLLHEFAVTIIAAVLISGFVSLTLTPMMCSRILKPHRRDVHHGRLYMAFERGFDAWRHAYDVSLRLTLRH